MTEGKRRNLIQLNQKTDSESIRPAKSCVDESKMKDDMAYLAKPSKIWSREELERSSPPQCPGVYAWYFRKNLLKNLLPKISSIDYTEYVKGWVFKKRWKLLYIGKGINLKRRIFDYHFCGDADVSSLRMSLGCLLARELKICLWKRPRPNEGEYGYTFGDEGEEKLSKWMAKNAWVAWIESPNHEKLEKDAIIAYSPLLNTEGNPHPLRPLKVLKSSLKACALLRGSKPPWKCIKVAYEEFEEQCKAYSSD